MKMFQIIVISLVVLTGANGIACEKHQQPSSDSTKEQIQK